MSSIPKHIREKANQVYLNNIMKMLKPGKCADSQQEKAILKAMDEAMRHLKTIGDPGNRFAEWWADWYSFLGHKRMGKILVVHFHLHVFKDD